MHIKYRFSLGALLLTLFCVSVYPAPAAAEPAAVTGVKVAYKNGQVTVSWNPLNDENIASYRVYYSQRSILENGGVYDDFEQTEGTESSLTLSTTPSYNRLYAAVLAVDADGEESEVFLEEASAVLQESVGRSDVQLQENPDVQIRSSASSSTKATFNVVSPTQQRSSMASQTSVAGTGDIPEWQQIDLGGTLHLLLTDVVSPTEIQLTFSAVPTVSAEAAPQAFTIVDAGGNELAITSLVLDQETVLINTATQVAGKVYEIQLSEPLQSTDGLPLDGTDRRAFFQGHPDGAADTAAAQQAQCSQQSLVQPKNVSNFRLRAQQQAGGNHQVTARWTFSNTCGDIMAYIVRQSRDKGLTFSEPQVLQLGISGIDIPDVTPGYYTLAISTMNLYGYTSQEVMETIELPDAEGNVPDVVTDGQTSSISVQTPQIIQQPVVQTPVPAVLQPQITTPTIYQPTTRLPQSGAAAALAGMGMTGTALGWYRSRRRKQR